MRKGRSITVSCTLLLSGALLFAASAVRAQDAKQIVEKAVQEELVAGRNDHSHWRYLDEQRDKNDSVFLVVETAHGTVKRLIERAGRPISQADAQAETRRIQSFIHSAAQLRRQQRDDAQDNKNAEDLLRLLPKAFLWSMGSEQGDLVTLHFKPDPDFDPPDMKSKAMAAMTGELVIDRKGHRIRTIKGRLTEDVNFGWGLLGKLRKGGTFDVERREIAPGLWQIVETHVHINGRALFFKSIGQQQDEIQTEFTRVSDSTTLVEAVTMLQPSQTELAGKTAHGSGR